MRKVILYVAMSLDGYLATADNQVDWLVGDNSDVDNLGTYFEFIKRIDTVLLGHVTYHQIINELAVNQWPYEAMISYVFTTEKLVDTKNIKFVNQEVSKLISQLQSKTGKDIWVCGGANLINQCIKDNLVDEYRIAIIPTILGGGIKLFSDDNQQIALKLVSCVDYNGIVECSYVRRNKK